MLLGRHLRMRSTNGLKMYHPISFILHSYSQRNKKDKSPQEFADRCKSLAYKTVPKVEDAAKQKWHYKQGKRMLLASFTSGLVGQPGKFTSLNLPENMEQAL
jgi:cytochrome c5